MGGGLKRNMSKKDTQTSNLHAAEALSAGAQVTVPQTADAKTSGAHMTDTHHPGAQTDGAAQADPLWKQLYEWIQKTAKEQEAI